MAQKKSLCMDTDRITRIQKMEELYDHVKMAADILTEYVESGLWLEDYEADERGEIPQDLKRGVLSQDGLDNLFDTIDSLEQYFASSDAPTAEESSGGSSRAEVLL